jgi:TP901 family phage tail tape measure protein
MSRMSLDTAIRLSAEVKGGGAIDRVKRSLQDFGKTGQTSKRDLDQLRAATFQFSRANDQTIAGIRNSINAFRGLQEQARIGGREFKRYGEEIKQLEGKLKGLDGAATSAGTSLGQKLAAGLAAAGVGRALQGITAQAGRFDAEVRKAAATSPTEGALGALRKEIEAVAAVAAGTPTEVAALATALSRAGFTADQTTKSLRGIVLGAEATDIAFADMGGIVGTILKTFQMDASQTGSVVDSLVKSANSANQTVLDVGEAMSYAAGQASALGVSVDDTLGLIALLADAGVRGSRAGTTIATGFNRLQIAAGGGDSEMQELIKGSAKMIDAMNQLGASVLDAEGKLRPMDEVLIAIKRQMDGLSKTDQTILSKALFGADAGKGFLAVLQRSEADINKTIDAVNNAGGTAAETQKKMQGFDFAVKVLGGNVENLTNQIGGMIGAALKPLIDGLNDVLGAAQKLPEPVKQVGAAAAAAGLAVTGLVVGIAALKASLAIVGGVAALKVALLGAAGAAKAMAAALLLNPWVAAAAGVAALTVAAYNMNKPFQEFVDSFPQRFEAFFKALSRDATASMERVINVATRARDFAVGALQFVERENNSTMSRILKSLIPVDAGFTELARRIQEVFAVAFQNIGINWAELVGRMLQQLNPMQGVLAAMGVDVAGAMGEAFGTPSAQQRLTNAGVGATYTVGGITYSTATGRPVSGTQPFTPSAMAAPPAPMAAPSGGAAGGGSGGGGAAGAEVAKGVKELLRLTDAEIAAAVNTAIGEYNGPDPRGRTDVFANILARSRSSQYPSNLVDVVTQPGQYAPNFGRSRSQVSNPNLYGRARFEQVKDELMNPQMLSQSIRDVDSRLYFKGISQYPNMVKGVDFLRAQGQNFFHGPGRSDPGRNPQITTQLLGELGGGDVAGYLDQQRQQTEQRLNTLNDQANTAERGRKETELQLAAMREMNPIARQVVEADNEALRITQAYADTKAKIEESAKGATTEAENQAKADALSAIEADKKLKLDLNAAKLSEQLSKESEGLTSELEKIAKEAGDRLAFEREYAVLLKSGMNPELARQYLELDKIVDATRINLESRIRILEASALQLSAESEVRKEIEKQVALLNEKRKAIDGIAKDAKKNIESTTIKSEEQKIEGQIQKLKDEIKEMTSLSGQAMFAAKSIGDAFASSFRSIVDGTKSTKAALSDFFKSISERYLEMAVEIIAKQVQMIILQTILNAIGGAAAPSAAPSAAPALSFNPSGFAGRAIGGPVNPGEIRPVGERGPELFVPYQAGTIIPAEATEALAAINNAAQGRLMVPYMGGGGSGAVGGQSGGSGLSVPFQGGGQSGGSGLSVPFQGGGQSGGSGLSVPFLKGADGMDGAAAAGGSGGGTEAIKVETVMINQVEYATVDQLNKATRQAASQGAALAEKRARNNVSTRRSYR